MQIPGLRPKPTELEALRYMCRVSGVLGRGGEGAESIQSLSFFWISQLNVKQSKNRGYISEMLL